jgi:hypothetical protein
VCSFALSRRTPRPQQLFLQFITRYMHWSGQMRCRVTTLTRVWTDGSNSADLINGFDQETAAALMGRLVRASVAGARERAGSQDVAAGACCDGANGVGPAAEWQDPCAGAALLAAHSCANQGGGKHARDGPMFSRCAQATYKMETEEDFDATRFLDRSLIRLCQRCVAGWWWAWGWA